MKKPAILVVSGAAALGLVAFALGPGVAEQHSGLLRADDRVVVERGAEVYTAHCSACHGADLEGQPNWRVRGPDGRLPAPPHDASGHTWHHSGETLFRLTKYGVAKLIGDPNYVSAMPIYEDVLTDDEIIAVLSYIKSTWPEDIRNRHDEIEASQ